MWAQSKVMNITLSVNEKTIIEARKVAVSMGKNLNQIIREDLERLTLKQNRNSTFDEFESLMGQGNSSEWKFNRDELHE